MPTSSSPTSTCAPANISGSARGRNSTTPSPSSSSRRRTAGSGRTPISSTPTPRPSSSNVRKQTWRKAGFDKMTSEETIAACEKIFAQYLNGNALMSNAKHLRGSAWLNFNRVLCERWSTGNIVLLGDAAATAHFSVGSGTKLAMESAIALANDIYERARSAIRLPPLRGRAPAGSAAPAERRAQFDRMVRGRRALFRARSGAVQLFAAHPLAAHQPREFARARSGMAGRRREMVRAPRHRARAERRAAADVRAAQGARRSSLPTASASRRWRNTARVDGTPNDWHFVHYAERAKGGAGLVFTEMTCVSAQGRISPGCTGLYSDEHERAWKRLVDFVHAETEAKIAIQLGHSGLKGSTQLGWETSDAPLLTDNWEVIGPSQVPWSPRQPDAARNDARRHGQRARRISCARPRWPSAPASTGSNCITRTAT